MPLAFANGHGVELRLSFVVLLLLNQLVDVGKIAAARFFFRLGGFALGLNVVPRLFELVQLSCCLVSGFSGLKPALAVLRFQLLIAFLKLVERGFFA